MKLNLLDYDVEAPLNLKNISVSKVRIPLQQHIGKPAQSIVKKGESVKEGQTIGKIPDGDLGANIHASINGKIKEVTEEFISIES
jgi:Na+-translocating ferredoxin:NAD+ oxidoreductase RnfC subunit